MALATPYQEYIYKSRYARWLDDEQRREDWEETVERYVKFWAARHREFPAKRVRAAITGLDVMPSMRALMTAGPALDAENMAGYNCAGIGVNHPRVFDEILYILMCGTGVGFSVEEQFVAQLPAISPVMIDVNHTIVVEDSKGGWATAFRELLASLWVGRVPSWDTSLVRPAGARLKTFGGRASGPEPLVKLFKYAVSLFWSAAGRQLASVECHDLICMIADIVVVGGVRRSALISLSGLGDTHMRGAKSGEWWKDTSHRALANNSAVYEIRPSALEFMDEWMSLARSGSGERGIFNRHAINRKVASLPSRVLETFVTNPCAEIILRASGGLCNLTEVVVRRDDTLHSLLAKVQTAAIMGTFQSTLVNFNHVRPIWSENAQEERLLGVSLTGIMDHPVLSQTTDEARRWLRAMKDQASSANHTWADILGIPASVAITTVKPSGTVSQLVDSASGQHARYAEYYIRSVRADKKDPLALFMRAQGFRVEDAFGQEATTDVFFFPVKAPQGSVMRDDRTAIEQLEHYRMLVDEWCEHNASITVFVRDNEWLEVGAWVHRHFDTLCGVSFLPHSDHTYRQAPYEECSREEYERAVRALPTLDWEMLAQFETGDTFSSGREYACTANACEI